MIVHAVSNPESFINDQITQLMASAAVHRCFAIEYAWRQYYLPSQPEIQFIALVALSKERDSYKVQATLSVASADLRAFIVALDDQPGSLVDFVRQHQLPWFDLSAPLMLEPVYIPKPWGQEIWYTGIEVRGQSWVSAQERRVPLPWLLSLMPDFLAAGSAQHIILLKILDPLPDERYGDLYFEMHEQKQEVYIVTHIDSQAWPDGIGGIRLGFNQQKRHEFNDDAAFKAAYLAAVREYEAIRRDIDRRLDQQRLAHNIALHDPVNTATLNGWLDELPQPLLRLENEKRAAMYAYTAMQDLQVGDVVKVPCFTPHALQHGVRTVEFQTPVYERKILSFTQKVLTQTHWDTAAALENVSLETPATPELEQINSSAGVVVERVVMFHDFEVVRVMLSAGSRYQLPACVSYRLLMVISGSLVCYATESSTFTQAKYTDAPTYLASQAVLLPASLAHTEWQAGDEGAIVLLALPIETDRDGECI